MAGVGVHALVFVSGWSAEEADRAVEGAARHGYDVLEIPLIEPRAIDADATARLLERHGLRTVTSLALPAAADISSADPDCVARGESLLNEALAVSRDLGSAFMGGVLYSALRKYETAATAEGRASSVAVLARLAGRAREMGITLGLEPVNRYESNLINTGGQALELIALTGADNITLHLDSYHMNIEEGCVAGAVRRYRGRIGYVHVNESHRGYLGSGSIDFAAFFRALVEAGYEGRSRSRRSRQASGIRSSPPRSPSGGSSGPTPTISPPARGPSSRSGWPLPKPPSGHRPLRPVARPRDPRRCRDGAGRG